MNEQDIINLLKILKYWEPLLDAYDAGQTDDQSIIENFKIEVRALGSIANQQGGYGMMQELITHVPAKMQRLVELSWHGIGGWMA